MINYSFAILAISIFFSQIRKAKNNGKWKNDQFPVPLVYFFNFPPYFVASPVRPPQFNRIFLSFSPLI